MSTQSIRKLSLSDTQDRLDEFLICEGNLFRNIVDYDLDFKVDYCKMKKVLHMRKLIKRSKDCEKVILIINKILR